VLWLFVVCRIILSLLCGFLPCSVLGVIDHTKTEEKADRRIFPDSHTRHTPRAHAHARPHTRHCGDEQTAHWERGDGARHRARDLCDCSGVSGTAVGRTPLTARAAVRPIRSESIRSNRKGKTLPQRGSGCRDARARNVCGTAGVADSGADRRHTRKNGPHIKQPKHQTTHSPANGPVLKDTHAHSDRITERNANRNGCGGAKAETADESAADGADRNEICLCRNRRRQRCSQSDVRRARRIRGNLSRRTAPQHDRRVRR